MWLLSVPPDVSDPTEAHLGHNVNGVWVPSRASNLPLTVDGFLGAGVPSQFVTHGHRLQPPVGFVTTDHLFPSELSRLWSSVVLTRAEQRTVEALRLVDPLIERIAIAGNDGSANARVLLRGADAPVPLGTLGEGVSRILTLALQLAVAEGGFLLVDEIENGFHWSVMPSVWSFLVETALALDVQVFATTHSKDCLEGLAALRRTHAELSDRVSVHRLEAGRQTTVRFDAGRIAEYLEMELEVR